MNKIYIFSGLGVDKKVFDKIDFGCLDPEFIDWIEPKKNESLSKYCKRISQKIKVENATVIGLSFGGIVAVEIAKILKLKRIILVASAKTKKELPLAYRIVGKLNINKWIPTFALKQQNWITNYFFGVKTIEEKILLKNILLQTDAFFLKWAINEIVNWNNIKTPENYIHIHGDGDKIIPISNVKTDYIIKNAGHFMTVTNAKEIEQILQNAINN